MQRSHFVTLAASLLAATSLFSSLAEAGPANARNRADAAARPAMGGGLIEFLFGDDQAEAQGGPIYRPDYAAPAAGYEAGPRYEIESTPRGPVYVPGEPAETAQGERTINPIYLKQTVSYSGREPAGSIIIDTPNRFLFLVNGDGTALRYGIGVGRPGFSWAGIKTISAKREWPGWTPPPEMLKRRPDLPRHMEGGPENPLGARAMYLGSSLYRIHGSNEPWTIGTAVSSGCIRMRNEDVIDLYGRVKVGTRVRVI